MAIEEDKEGAERMEAIVAQAARKLQNELPQTVGFCLVGFDKKGNTTMALRGAPVEDIIRYLRRTARKQRGGN